DYPGGKNQEGEYSSLKINFIKDLKHNLPVDVKITAGTKNDFKFLPKGLGSFFPKKVTFSSFKSIESRDI
ncbi:hypothetical protein, partial [Cetobacterium sp.]|uniref:hypothetical protein n=1 Tax=Cetobacterium sp. TaxID=2071632 RepID=UPI003F2C3F82